MQTALADVRMESPVKGGSKVHKFVVAYAKITEDKDTGILMQGVYFGGLGDSADEAETIARECVNTIRGGTILPKVVKITGPEQVVEALHEAQERFERITAQMRQADEIINRTNSRKH